MGKSATIIDVGRGPQLSTRRIAVQDLLPFFKRGDSNAEIFRWYPQLEQCELDLLRQYFVDRPEEVLNREREIAARNLEARNISQRPSLPTDGMSSEEKREWMLKRLAERQQAEQSLVHGSTR